MLLLSALVGSGALVVASASASRPSPVTCPSEVHERYVTRAPDGTTRPTWHPPVDPLTGCAFDHEHGSDPSRFIGAQRIGAPAFGWLAARMGMAEPHAGFKVYVVNDDRRGKAWMALLHQGTASPRRAAVSHHTLELWMVRRRDRAALAKVHAMADFGAFVPDCDGARPAPAARILPTLGPGCARDYESWVTQLSIGGRLRAGGIAFGVDNPTTVIDRADPARLVFNGAEVCGRADPAGAGSTCKGDRRWLAHPRWLIANRGPAVFYTDPHGRRASHRPFPGAVRQYVRPGIRVDERREWGGASVEYRMARPGDGGIFRPAQPRRSRGFDVAGAVRWPN